MTGAEKYLAERLADPAYRAAYEKAKAEGNPVRLFWCKTPSGIEERLTTSCSGHSGHLLCVPIASTETNDTRKADRG